MSRRIVLQHHAPEHGEAEFVRHSPLLLAAVLPIASIGLAIVRLVSLDTAVNIAIGLSLLLLFVWSLWSAKAFRTNRFGTLVIASLELAIGVGIVALKMSIGH
jgi:hypothetical protein